MLIDGLEMAYVNSFAYKRVVPVPDEEVPARFQRAEEVFAGRLWRDQLREWDETFKPASIATHRELQSIDPDELSDEDVVAYLTRCRDHHAEMIYQHMRFTGAAVVPMGDFLAHAGDWTGLPPAEILGLMRGSAPVSAGASTELDRLKAAVAGDAAAQQLLESEDAPLEALAALRRLEGGTGAAASAYLDLVGYRLINGFDIAEHYALELPDVLLRAIRVAVDGGDVGASDVEERAADVRGRVPEEHRAQFDELLDEARATYRIRDERGVFSDIWASGIMRRAVLAAGRRLAEKGRLHDAEHLIDAGFEEMRSLLSGADDSIGGRARRTAEGPHVRHREGRAGHARARTSPTAGPIRAAARRSAGHACDGHRHRGDVRQLAGGTRRGPSPRPCGQPGDVRGACALRLRPGRVRPDRPGRRPRHPVDERSVQHPPAAARRHRDGQRGSAFARGDRGS